MNLGREIDLCCSSRTVVQETCITLIFRDICVQDDIDVMMTDEWQRLEQRVIDNASIKAVTSAPPCLCLC